MNSTEFQIAFTLIGSGSILTMIFTFIILRLTLGHRLKHALRTKGEYWDTGTWDFGFFSTVLFMWACVIPRVTRWDSFSRFYQNLEARQFANLFEIIIAHLCVIAVSITMVCTVFFITTEQLGIIQWQ